MDRRQLLKTAAAGVVTAVLPAAVAATPRRPSLWEYDFVASGAASVHRTPQWVRTTRLLATYRTADRQRWCYSQIVHLEPDGRLHQQAWKWTVRRIQGDLRCAEEHYGTVPATELRWFVRTGANEMTAVDIAAGVFLDDVTDLKLWSRTQQRYLP